MVPDQTTLLLFGSSAAAAVVGIGTAYRLSHLANKEHRGISLSDFVTWSDVLDDQQTVRCIDGACFRVLRFKGTDYSSLNNTFIANLTEKRREWLMSLKETGVFLRIFSAHSTSAIPHTETGTGILGDIDRAWAEHMAHSFSTDHYVMLSVATEKEISYLERACHDAVSYTSEHLPLVLTNNPNSSGNSPLLSFLFYLLNGYSQHIKPLRQSLAHALSPIFIEPSLDGDIVLHRTGGAERCAVLSIEDVGAVTDRTIMSALFSLKAHFDLVITADPLSTLRGHVHCRKQKNKSRLVFGSGAAHAEWTDAENDVQENRETIVQASIHLVVKAADSDGLNTSISHIEETLAKHRYRVVREKNLAWRIFCSRLPGFDKITRIHDYMTSHLADLMPFSAAPTGNTASVFGPHPIRHVPTAGQQAAYALTYQPTAGDDSAPHDIYFAKSRSGKTVFLSFLLSGALSVHKDLAAILFDRNEGLRVFTEFVNGSYLSPEKEDLPFNFFDNDGTDADRDLAQRMLALMAGIGLDDNEALTDISGLVASMYEQEPSERFLRDLFDETVPTTLRKSLRPWVKEGERYGRIFNGDHDTFDPTSARVTTVALDSVADDAKLSGILCYYMMRRFQNAYVSLGRPYKFIVDEASTLLRDPAISDHVMAEIRTAGKNKGAVTTIWQDVSGLWANPHGKALASNTGSFYFWPGTAASIEELEFFNMTETEQSFALGQWQPEGSIRPVMIKRDTETVFLETSLHALGPLLAVFCGGVDRNRRLLICKKEFGADWRREYLRSVF